MGFILLAGIAFAIFSGGVAFMNKASDGNGGAPIVYGLFVVLSGMIAVLGWVISFIAPRITQYFYTGALYLLVFTAVVFCIHIMYLVVKLIFAAGR